MRRAGLVLAAIVLLAACGSAGSGSGGQAQTLLKQTFSGSHTARSGVLAFSLTLTPTGSKTISTPISFGVSGPFQSRGTGNLPASDLSLSVDALGHHGQLGVLSTGTHGYLTLQGTTYRLPPAQFQKLASSFAGATGGSGTGGLAKLGIVPLHWLKNPTVAGTQTVGGAPTTHILAHVDVAALLADLNTFLMKTSSTATTKLPSGISLNTRQTIASTVKNATVNVWTGTSDKTLRKLTLNLSLPVSGQFSALFGGLTSASLGLNLQYANLNQPQTIATPSNVQPFSGFASRFSAVMKQVRSTLGAASPGATTGGGSASGTGTAGANSANIARYSQCLQKAHSDVTKMQQCAGLLNGH